MKNAPIIQITLHQGAHAITRHRDRTTRPIQDRISVVRIEDVAGRSEWPRGIYLFTSLDGMNPEQLTAAKWLWDRLAARPDCFAVLNEPGRVVGRYRLLRHLHETGVNDFNVHMVGDRPKDVRFPAFVRYEHLHRANLTPLLHSQDELDDALARILLSGEKEEGLMVTEFLDYKDDDGYYRKYGAQLVGEKLWGRHLWSSRSWMLKLKYADPAVGKAAEVAYIADFPHSDLLAPVFEFSGHGWARMDYSFYKGRLQVWEINDNPEIGAKRRRLRGRMDTRATFYASLGAQLDRVSESVEPGQPLSLRITPSEVLVARN